MIVLVIAGAVGASSGLFALVLWSLRRVEAYLEREVAEELAAAGDPPRHLGRRS